MEDYLLDIVYGRKKGFFAFLIKKLLSVLSVIYNIIVRLRSLLYEKNILNSKKLNNPVISIGNITAGGTGKTPFTAFLVEKLKKDNDIAVISRGYGAQKKTKKAVLVSDGKKFLCGPELAGDELFMLSKKIKDTLIVRAEDRYTGGIMAEKIGFSGLVVLDDAFQHYQLDRSVDIVLIDGENPFSNKKMLPAGLLREPLSELKRADVIVITRTEGLSDNKLKEIKMNLSNYIKESTPIFKSEVKNDSILTIDDVKKYELGFLAEKKVFAFCAIASPEAFRKSLKKAKADIADFRTFEDHYNYQKEDFMELIIAFQKSEADFMITTEKDAVKITKYEDIFSGIPLFKLAIKMSLKNEKEFMDVLKEKLR